MKREEMIAALEPLTSRLCTSHIWRNHRHVDEPLTAVHLSEHVMGGAKFGLCPIAPGESTCRVACLDFDSHKGEIPWPQMGHVADAVALSLEMDGFNPVLFRSSGGNGIHLYLIWDTPQDAYSVREMLRRVLDTCDLSPGTGGLIKNQVEIFPKQDEVPSDGFGNMFVLPFTGKSEYISGEWLASPDVRVHARPAREVVDAAQVTTPDLIRLKSALDAIPNTSTEELSYDDWRNTIFGIHHATDGSGDGLALAHEFSARSSKYEPSFLDERVWPHIRSERSGAVVTDRSIYSRAAEHGWHDPALADEFDVVTDEPKAKGASHDDTDTPRFTFVDFATFTNGPEPEYFIDGVIPRAGLVVVYGASTSGKTFLAIDIVGSVARGVDWRDCKVTQGRVGYIVAEGAGGFRNRLKAYAHHNDLPSFDIALLAGAPNFGKKEDITDLIHAMRAWGRMDLIVVDTFAQVMSGGDENSGEDVGRALGHCRTIHEVTGATVMLIHHSGKDETKGARGWSGLRAAADAEIEIARIEHDRVITVKKMKDGEDGTEFGFKLLTVPVGMNRHGDVMSSCVVEHTAAVARDKRKSTPRGTHEKAVHQIVIDLHGLDGSSPTTDAVLTEYCERTPHDSTKRDMRRRDAMRAIESLRDRGSVAVEGDFIKLPREE